MIPSVAYEAAGIDELTLVVDSGHGMSLTNIP